MSTIFLDEVVCIYIYFFAPFSIYGKFIRNIVTTVYGVPLVHIYLNYTNGIKGQRVKAGDQTVELASTVMVLTTEIFAFSLCSTDWSSGKLKCYASN